jgi:hypothetical protein
MTCNTAVFGELRTINVYVLYAMELPRRNLTIVSAIAFLETSVWIEGTHAHHAEEDSNRRPLGAPHGQGCGAPNFLGRLSSECGIA